MVTTTTTSAPPRRVSARAVPPRSLLPLRFKAKLLPGRGNPSKARNWSPPSPSRLGPSSLSSQESPLHSVAPLPRSSPCSTRDYLRNKAIKILESVDALPLTCFLNELNFPENSIDLMDARKLLNYLKKNYLTSFCLCLVSYLKFCATEFVICKEYAFDVLCQILTENKHDLWQETSFMNKELKSALLDCLNTESSIEILHKISDFVATIATKEVRLGNEWPELLEFVYESISSDSDSEEKVKCAISLLFKLIPQCAVEDMVISIDSFYESLVDIFDSEEMSLEKITLETGAAETDIQNLPVVRCLARIAASLGGEVLVNNFLKLFAIHFGAEDWQSRHAAVLFLGIVAEKCSKPEELKQGWNQMAGRIIRSVDEDMHPHVRWAALYTIKQFSKHLKPEFQDKYHEKVMPVLTKAMDDFSNPRVQVQAYLALFDFTWNCSSSTLKPYLKEIVNKLLKQLQKVNPMVQGETLRVLSAVAHSSRDHFAEYYSSVMPYLKVIMMTANEELDHNHLADSVECITMVWLCNCSCPLQGSKLEENDPMRSQLLQAWARLGKCLGQEFRPYMSVAIPLLIKSAKIGSYVIIPKNPDEVDESDGSIRALILGDRKIWIKTKVLEEKLKACEGLVARTLVPRLRFEHSEEIRRVAASAMPVLLKSSKVATQEGYLERSADESPFKKLCSYVVPALVKALSKESLPEIATIILDSLDECMKMSEHVLDEDQTDLFLKTIMNVLQKISSLSRSRVGAIEGINKTLPHEENGEEQKVYDKAADCLTTFIRTHKNTFSPFIGKLAPCIELMWTYPFRLMLDWRVLSIWLGHLPLKNNLEEAKVVHRQLCSLVEVSDVELLGTQKAYLSEIVAVYAEILWAGKKLATEETVNQMIKQLKLHRRRSPHSTWRSIMLSLELHLQKKLESMLTS
ncbi:hypothetical protein OIU77_001339 [Salix suchowensis]|uniref:ARM repeat superfamily protein n=1 Tax=Salix suchowensis TaxID=1278906 RepID=A0ABQ9B389_9ROSI|nr:hypothetical protein OIU77_001339 [Salix suchowensis]